MSASLTGPDLGEHSAASPVPLTEEFHAPGLGLGLETAPNVTTSAFFLP